VKTEANGYLWTIIMSQATCLKFSSIHYVIFAFKSRSEDIRLDGGSSSSHSMWLPL